MQLIYAQEELPAEFAAPSIFLAGPTPRSPEVTGWRAEALELLEESEFEGVVLLPEPRSGVFRGEYTDQVAWEWAGLDNVDAIAFWMPRSLPEMPGFTSNIEFGLYAPSGRCVLGYPQAASKMRYLDWMARELGVPVYETLYDTLQGAIELAHSRFTPLTAAVHRPSGLGWPG